MTTRRILLSLGAAFAVAVVALFGWPGLLRKSGEPTGVIIFQGRDSDGYGIFSVLARGGPVRYLPVPVKGSVGAPRYSPDGRSLAFIGDDAGGREPDLYVSGPRGENPHSIAPTPDQPEGAPAWSPDGTTIVFASKRDGNWEIYTVHPDGSALTRLTNDPAFDSTPVFSPDGRTIAFTSDRGTNPEHPSHLFVMNADGTNVRQISTGEDDSTPDYSPDGRRIAYVGFTGGNADIWVADADGSHARRVTIDKKFQYTPRWSPDGTWIAFENYLRSFPDLFLIRPDGSDRRQLTDVGSYAGSPAWRPMPAV
jgi:TolB protein